MEPELVYFGPGGKLDKAVLAYGSGKISWVSLVSPFYSAYTHKAEWDIISGWQKFWWSGWALFLGLRIMFCSPEKLSADQCDVLATVLLQMAWKVPKSRKRLINRILRLVTEGHKKWDKAEGKPPHTGALLHVSRASLACLMDDKGRALDHIHLARELAPSATDDNQRARVYGGMAVTYARMVREFGLCEDGDKIESMISLMYEAVKAAEDSGTAWPDLRPKHDDKARSARSIFAGEAAA